MEKYSIIDDVLYLNSSNPHLSEIHPYEYTKRTGSCFMPDVDQYPTKYYLRDIFVPDTKNFKTMHTLEIISNEKEFDIKLTNENLVYILLEISKRKYWASSIAVFLLEELKQNPHYVDWYKFIV